MPVDRRLRVDVGGESTDKVVLTLHGELDLVGAPALQTELERDEVRGAAAVLLDLEDVSFIDSTGLRVILSAHRAAQERGQALSLTRGSAQVQRLFSIAGVDEHLSFAD